MNEPGLRISGSDRLEGSLECRVKRAAGASLGLAQGGFELGPALLNWIELGGNTKAAAPAMPPALNELGNARHLVHGQMDWANDGVQRMGGAPWLQYRIALLAQAYAKTGQTEKGLVMLNETLVQVERTGEKIDYAEMLRLKGELLLMHDHGAMKDVEVCFRAALEVARTQEARW